MPELTRLETACGQTLTKPWELVSKIAGSKRGRLRGPLANLANLRGLRRRSREERRLEHTGGGGKLGAVASTPSPACGTVTDKSPSAKGLPGPPISGVSARVHKTLRRRCRVSSFPNCRQLLRHEPLRQHRSSLPRKGIEGESILPGLQRPREGRYSNLARDVLLASCSTTGTASRFCGA